LVARKNKHFNFIVHYYNYLSDGWDANIYPRTRFASEFGFQSFPSMASIQAVAGPGDLDLGLSSEMMTQRQHHPLGNTELQMQVKHRLLPPGNYSFDTEEMFAKLVPLTQVIRFFIIIFFFYDCL
jgi:beta-mannosidase